jgi:hypothetical protein
MLRTRLSAAIICAVMSLTGCATHETYGDRSLPQGERAVIEGYRRYQLLYFEELQIVLVDGKLVDGPLAYASSLSVPSGKHWLQFLVLRNKRDITMCAFEWMFEAGHHYKLHQLHHEQALLAHPTSPRFQASIAMDISGPAGSAQRLSARAECGHAAHCLRPADCPPNRSCQMDTGFEFGRCVPDDR